MKNLFGETIVNGFLAPGTQITVRIHKRNPIDALVERPQISEAVYFNTDTTAAITAQEVIEYKFVSLVILYESVSLSSQQKMDEMRKKTAKYFVDIPKIVVQKVPGSVMITENRLPIQKGTKLIILTWMKSMQLFHQKTKNKNLSVRFHYPRNAIRTTFELSNSRGSLLYERGLEHLGTTEGPTSPTCIEYHRSLLQRRLYSKPLEKLFPKSMESNDQSVILDVSDKHFPDNSAELLITNWYNDTMSEEGWYQVAATLQQAQLSLAEKTEVKAEILV